MKTETITCDRCGTTESGRWFIISINPYKEWWIGMNPRGTDLCSECNNLHNEWLKGAEQT